MVAQRQVSGPRGRYHPGESGIEDLLPVALLFRRSVRCWFGAGAPEARLALLSFFAQALELAAVGVGEGGGPGVTLLQEILVEEVLVGAISVRVEVEVGEGPAVGVLGVAYARDLQPDQVLREGLLGVGAGLLTVAAYGLVRRDGLGGIHPDHPHMLDLAVDLHGDGVAVRDLLDLAVDPV